MKLWAGGTSMMGLVPLMKRSQLVLSLPPTIPPLKKPGRGPSLEPNHAGTLILGFQPPELWEINVRGYLSNPVYGVLVTAAQTKTRGILYFLKWFLNITAQSLCFYKGNVLALGKKFESSTKIKCTFIELPNVACFLLPVVRVGGFRATRKDRNLSIHPPSLEDV